jgi:hypothetical protein
VRSPNREFTPRGKSLDQLSSLLSSVAFFEPQHSDRRSLASIDAPSSVHSLNSTPPPPLQEEGIGDPSLASLDETEEGEIIVAEPETSEEAAVHLSLRCPPLPPV